MKNKKIFRTFAALCTCLMLMGGFSVTAFAQGTDPAPTATPAADATNDSNVVVEETEDSPALTPEGNAALVDDFGGNKQLITVTTKAGNYFYILIDRANEDKETAVHFLNQVDEADLEALMEDGETAEETPAVCNCTEKCAAGAVNTACPVCAVNMAECTGQEPEPTPDPETEPEPEQEPAGLNPAMLLVVLAVLGGIGALVYFKFIKQKPKTKGSDNLDDYDYGEDDTEQEDEDPWETEESDQMTRFTDSPFEPMMTRRPEGGKAASRPPSLSPGHPCYGCGNYRPGQPCVGFCHKELTAWLRERRKAE